MVDIALHPASPACRVNRRHQRHRAIFVLQHPTRYSSPRLLEARRLLAAHRGNAPAGQSGRGTASNSTAPVASLSQRLFSAMLSGLGTQIWTPKVIFVHTPGHIILIAFSYSAKILFSSLSMRRRFWLKRGLACSQCPSSTSLQHHSCT